MSNQRHEAEIKRALGLHPTVRLADVRVQVVEDGAVLLGTVATLEEKEAAGRAAAAVPGVRRVENRLTVTANHSTSDREQTRQLVATGRVRHNPAQRSRRLRAGHR